MKNLRQPILLVKFAEHNIKKQHLMRQLKITSSIQTERMPRLTSIFMT